MFVAVSGALMLWAGGVPYVLDANETFSVYWHARNLVHFDAASSALLADESFSPAAAAHAFTHTHQGNWPRVFGALIWMLGARTVAAQVVVTTLVVGSASTYLGYRFLARLVSPLFALVFMVVLTTDYINFAQWAVVPYRVWYGFFFFAALCCVEGMRGDNRRWWAVALALNSICLFYFELVFVAFVCLTATAYAALRTRSWRFAAVVALLQGGGGAVSLTILFVQLLNYLGYQDVLTDLRFTFGARNASDSSSIEAIKAFYGEHNIAFWYNFQEGNNLRTFSGFVRSLYDGTFMPYAPQVLAGMLLVALTATGGRLVRWIEGRSGGYLWLANIVPVAFLASWYYRRTPDYLTPTFWPAAVVGVLAVLVLLASLDSVRPRWLYQCVMGLGAAVVVGMLGARIAVYDGFRCAMVAISVAALTTFVSLPIRFLARSGLGRWIPSAPINRLGFLVSALSFAMLIFVVWRWAFDASDEAFIEFPLVAVPLGIVTSMALVRLLYPSSEVPDLSGRTYAIIGMPALVFAFAIPRLSEQAQSYWVGTFGWAGLVGMLLPIMAACLSMVACARRQSVALPPPALGISGLGSFLGATFAAYSIVFLLSPGYVISGYTVRSAPFAVFFLTAALAWVLWYPSSIAGHAGMPKPIRRAGVATAVALAAIWTAVQVHWIALFPPDYYTELLDRLAQPPYRGASIVSNNYAAPFAAATGQWAYYDQALMNDRPKPTDAGWNTGLDGRYIWFADRASNSEYRHPDYFVCTRIRTITLSMQEFVDGNPTADCRKTGIALGAASSFRPYHHQIVDWDRAGAAKTGVAAWAIFKLEWSAPPYLAPANGGDARHPVALDVRRDARGLSLQASARYAHQDGVAQKAMIYELRKLSDVADCDVAATSRQLLVSSENGILHPGSYGDGLYQVWATPVALDGRRGLPATTLPVAIRAEHARICPGTAAADVVLPPVNVIAEDMGNNFFSLRWDAVPGAARYETFYASGEELFAMSPWEGPIPTYSFWGGMHPARFSVVVRSCGADGRCSLPSAPLALHARALGLR